MSAWGRVRQGRLPASTSVREASEGDLADVCELASVIRGAAYGADLALLLAEGAELLVLDDGGYAVVREGSPVLLGAVSEEAATEVLHAALARAPHDRDTEVRWLTSGSQWAITASLRAGLELHPVGPVMVRGLPGPPARYLPSGAFG